MKAIVIRETGGPEVLKLEDIQTPEPGPGQARVRVSAIGVNFIDVYYRLGLYAAKTPFTPGREAAGVVDAVGPDAQGVAVGDRVGFAMDPGSYGESVCVPADHLLKVPEGVSFEQAAAVLLQGMTAHYLSHDTFPLAAGQVALVLAAAGGAGRLLVQMAVRRGARVIGATSTEEKAALVRSAGASDVILYRDKDLAEEARRLTNGKGVDVVYDSVGKDTFSKSLAALRPRGMLALYGQSSGPVEPMDPQVLNQKGSLFLTRPSLGHYVAERKDLEKRAADVFDWIRKGKLDVRVDKTFPLEKAADAHRHLEAGKTMGKVLLKP